MMQRRTLLRIAAIGGAGLVAGCGAGPAAVRPSSGVLEVARANGLTGFLQAVDAAGLRDQLSGAGPYTVFAPSNAAFQAIPTARRNQLFSPAGQADLRRLVAYHVVPGMVPTSFMDGMDMNHLTSAGGALNVDGRGAGIRVNGANMTRRDLEAGNGVVHVIDRVLTPS